MAKTTTTERYEVCSLCGGRGQEYCANTTSGTQTCRQCHGSGQHLVERTIVTTHDESSERAGER